MQAPFRHFQELKEDFKPLCEKRHWVCIMAAESLSHKIKVCKHHHVKAVCLFLIRAGEMQLQTVFIAADFERQCDVICDNMLLGHYHVNRGRLSRDHGILQSMYTLIPAVYRAWPKSAVSGTDKLISAYTCHSVQHNKHHSVDSLAYGMPPSMLGCGSLHSLSSSHTKHTELAHE